VGANAATSAAALTIGPKLIPKSPDFFRSPAAKKPDTQYKATSRAIENLTMPFLQAS
jgi:hypothetical protein